MTEENRPDLSHLREPFKTAVSWDGRKREYEPIPQYIKDKANDEDCIELAKKHVKGIVKTGKGKQWNGPCPECGGEDRFIVKTGGFYCRGCKAKGDTIQFVQFLKIADSFPKAIEYLTGYTAAKKEEDNGGNGKAESKQEKEIETEPIPYVETLPDLEEKQVEDNGPGASVARIAAKIGIPADFLTAHFQMKDLSNGTVEIPYYDQDGKQKRTRIRLRMSKEKDADGKELERFSWGAGTDIIPYGCAQVDKQTDYLIIAEGESDTNLLCYHGYPVIGIPGSTFAKCLQAEHIPPTVQEIAIVQEADEAGITFAKAVAEKLREIGFTGRSGRIVMPKKAKDPCELHAADPTGFKVRFDKMIDAALDPLHGCGMSADELKAHTFPPLRMIIQGLLPEGATLLAAKPKKGKSWLALQIAIAVANGGKFGGVQADQGGVLYFALEDKRQRIKQRIEILGEWPRNFNVIDELPVECYRDQNAILQYIRELANRKRGGSAIHDLRLIVIDTLAVIQPRLKRGDNEYLETRSFAQMFSDLGKELHAAIVGVYHNRKGESEDPQDMIMGSNGLFAGVDGAFILHNQVGSDTTTLYVRHRDMQDKEIALQFDQSSCRWEVKGDALDYPPTEAQRKIHNIVKQTEKGLTRKEIAQHYYGKQIINDAEKINVNALVKKMVMNRYLTEEDGFILVKR